MTLYITDRGFIGGIARVSEIRRYGLIEASIRRADYDGDGDYVPPRNKEKTGANNEKNFFP